MRTETVNIYKFSELSESAKEKARDWYRDGDLDYDWWGAVYELATTAGKMLGISVDNIYFQGFYTQGSGACVTGSYSYNKGWKKELEKEFGSTLLEEIVVIGKELQAVQSKAFYKLSATLSYQRNSYSSISVEHEDRWAEDDEEQELRDALKSFEHWVFSKLEQEYEYLTSDEVVDESIEANEYEFYEDGSIAF